MEPTTISHQVSSLVDNTPKSRRRIRKIMGLVPTQRVMPHHVHSAVQRAVAKQNKPAPVKDPQS